MTTQNKNTFLLKGVDPIKLINDYYRGEFSVIPNNIKKFPLSQNNKLIESVYGTSDRDPIFSIKDKNNNTVIITTSGHSNYELFMASDGEYSQIGGRCDFCKKDFNHQNLGYPVEEKEYTLLIDDENPYYKIHYVFWMYGETCSLECSLSEIRMKQCRHSTYKDNLTKNSEYMLHKLFKLMYPKSESLRPAQNPKLLKINKGSLTNEEWQNPKYIYKNTDRILMLPVKIEYIQKLIL